MPNMAYAVPTPAPRYRLGRHDHITIGDASYIWASTNEMGHVLRRQDNGDVTETFTHERIHELMRTDRIKIDRDWFRGKAAELRLRHGETLLSDLPEKDRNRILWKQEYCERFLRMEHNERSVSRSDASMRAAIARISVEVASIERTRQTNSGRCGSAVTVLMPPSPSRLRDWLKRYEGADYNPMALRDGYGKSGRKEPRIDPDSYQFAAGIAKRYASSGKPTKVMLFRDYERDLGEANEARQAEGMAPFTKISRRSFELLIDKVLTPFEVFAAREGIETAKKKNAIVQGGNRVAFPLERVEMDEWKVSLQTLLVDAGLWAKLTREQKAEVERSRTWLSAAIDTATRCILAMRLSTAAPSSASAIATLEMAVNDKSVFTEVAGAQAPWDMHGRMQTLAMDAGAAFIAAETQAVVRDLGVEPFYPPAGMPHLRPYIERLFSTFQRQVVRYFPGQTFENIFAKGEYDSEGHACLSVEELNRTLIRYVVDVYHNTPHEGLAFETPRNAWLRLTAKYGVLPPPDLAVRRHIFGIPCQPRIGNKGIRVLGLYYQSEALQRLRLSVGQKSVLVRVDRHDLGEISVRVKDGWLSVPAAVEGVRLCGVTFWEWVAAARDLRRRNADLSKLSVGIVNAAIASFHETAEMATARAELGSPIMTREEFDKLDRDLFRTFAFADGGPASDEDILGMAAENTATGPDSAPAADLDEHEFSQPDDHAPPDDDEFGGKGDWLTDD